MRAAILFLLLAQDVSVDAALRMAADGRLPEAEAALRAIAARAPRDADVRFRLGLVLLKETKFEEAAVALTEATNLEPRSVLAHLALGDVRLRQGNRAEAAREASEAQELAGNSISSWKALAVLQSRLANAPGESRALETLIRLAPEEHEPYVRLANLLLQHRTPDAARLMADAGLRHFVRDPELLRLRGLALYGLGRKPEAIDTFLVAMDAAPDNEIVAASIETLIPDAGDRLARIIQRLRRFSEQRPASPLGPFLLALASPSATEKMSLLRRSISADASFWPAYFEMHRVFREQGKPREATQALETTLKLNPNHEGAHFALAELYMEAGERDKARQHRLEHHRLRSAAAPLQ